MWASLKENMLDEENYGVLYLLRPTFLIFLSTFFFYILNFSNFLSCSNFIKGSEIKDREEKLII